MNSIPEIFILEALKQVVDRTEGLKSFELLENALGEQQVIFVSRDGEAITFQLRQYHADYQPYPQSVPKRDFKPLHVSYLRPSQILDLSERLILWQARISYP